MSRNLKLVAVLLSAMMMAACGGSGEIIDPPPQGDTTAPTITLIGESNITIGVHDIFTDPGATVVDDIDSGLSASAEGDVDTTTAGTYTITYSVEDAAGNSATATRTVIVEEADISPVEGDAYIFHSAHDDSFAMMHWGDVWGTGTQYTDQPSDTTYAKALELTKSSDWGTVVAWGNEPEDSVNIAGYTHAKFKVKTSTFTQVQVFVQSPNDVDTEIIYNLSSGIALADGWVEMEVGLPGFTDMSWFALNFIGDSGTVLLADVFFTEQSVVVTGPPEAAPIPVQNDDDVIVLYSDSLVQDSHIAVWNSNWWNAPVYAEGDIEGDHFAKYQITDGGTVGGVVGLEYGYEIEPLDASSTTTWNFDLYIEPGISNVTLQLVSDDGGATYILNNPAAGLWTSYAIPYENMTDNDGGGAEVLNPGTLVSIGMQLSGPSGQSVYLDNVFFSGASTSYDLDVTVTDSNTDPVMGANVSVGNVSSTTGASGIATLTLPEGEHKVVVDANGYGVAQGNQTVSGGDASIAINIVPLNSGPTIGAPTPTETNEEAVVIYSDALTVDQNISYWSDNWWNAPTFSEETIDGNAMGRLQIIPDGVAGGVTGIQYGIADGALDATGVTRIRFDMFATSGITQAVFQVVSSGAGDYTMGAVTTGEWVTVDLALADFENAEKIVTSSLTQMGVALWGTTSDALYIDNIYFY